MEPHIGLIVSMLDSGLEARVDITSSNQRCMGSTVSSGAVVFPFLLFAKVFCDNKRYIDSRYTFLMVST